MQFGRGRVLVIGDVMLDHYWVGATQRISPEAPVPIVRKQDNQTYLGGAAHVAANAVAYVDTVNLLGIIGRDTAGEAIQSLCQAQAIQAQFQVSQQQPTIQKLRIISQQKQMLRVDEEQCFAASLSRLLLTNFQTQLAHTDVVIFSDYAKGTLHRMPELLRLAKDKTTVVDPKTDDFSVYAGANLLIPSQCELESAIGSCADQNSLIEKSRTLLSALDIGAVLVTQGKCGMTLIPQHGEIYHVPAIVREVYDVTGASDVITAFMGIALANGYSLQEGMQLANAAASIAVGQLGTSTVVKHDLMDALDNYPIDNPQSKICSSIAQAKSQIDVAKARGQKVVMTNGCFDILHLGHIGYLRSARALGDRLLIAVNVDDSVRRLGKDGERPFFPLAQRLAVLASLTIVDWVVPFVEDTPLETVRALQPDVLVKGPDYTIDNIVGADVVQAYGGEVKSIGPYREGASTTQIINRLSTRTAVDILNEC